MYTLNMRANKFGLTLIKSNSYLLFNWMNLISMHKKNNSFIYGLLMPYLQDFLDTIKQRFITINVKKTHNLIKKGKTKEEPWTYTMR